MPIDLSVYGDIEVGLFVRLNCTKYRTTAGGAFSTQVLRFSDINRSITVLGETYTGLGQLLGITSSSSDLKISGNEVTVNISGIPNTSIAEIIHSKIKGSEIKIYRGVINTSTGGIAAIANNPVGRFFGIVTNYSLEEEYDVDSRTASNRITLNCASIVDVLNSKVSGRRTNPESQQSYYPSDLSMNRVPSLVGQYFDFGVPE